MTENYACSKTDDYEKLRRLQLTQLEILKFVDGFCGENNIKYSIAYGTILGAVRHGGFIPWDDDMDIFMLRGDYDKFISLWRDTPDFLLQNHGTEKDFTQSFTKIRKKNTAFVQASDLGKAYHKGVFIDIFPLDRVPDSEIKRKKQMLDAMLYNLFMRGHAPQGGGIFSAASKLILGLTRRKSDKKRIEKYLEKICRYNADDSLRLVDMSVLPTIRRPYNGSLLDKIISIDFENAKVKVISEYEYFLKTCYGDFMKLPPENERTWFHHPVFISFDSEYEENA